MPRVQCRARGLQFLGEHEVVALYLRMDASVQNRRVNVGEQGIQEVFADTFRLLLVEAEAGRQIFLRG